MVKLLKNKYETVRPLFAGLMNHLAVEAILTGEVTAEIFVDEAEKPGLALTRTRQRCFVGGMPGESSMQLALQACLVMDIIPGLREEGHEGCLLFYAPAWHGLIPGLLTGVRSEPILRHHYESNPCGELPAVTPPAGLTLRTVDAGLLDDPSFEGMQALREEMLSERASVEEFFAKSFGVVALADRVLAGWCLSEYNCAQRCEVGIGTQAPFRRRGLAQAMGEAFLQQARQNGIHRVGWDCFAKNNPSIATALRLGFEKVEEYPATVFWF